MGTAGSAEAVGEILFALRKSSQLPQGCYSLWQWGGRTGLLGLRSAASSREICVKQRGSACTAPSLLLNTLGGWKGPWLTEWNIDLGLRSSRMLYNSTLSIFVSPVFFPPECSCTLACPFPGCLCPLSCSQVSTPPS